MKRTSYVLLFLLFVIAQPTEFKGGNGGEGTIITREKVVSTFELQSFRISKEGMVSWTASNENGSLPFFVEQYIFNKWVQVGEVKGIGTAGSNSYSVPVILHKGTNKFRIRQKGYDKMSRFSDAVTFYSRKEAVTYTITHKNQTIEFSNDTYFIIYNPFGVIVKQGYGNSLDISDYAKGYYCMIYDNKLGAFQKKKVLFKNTPYPIELNPRHVPKNF